MSSEMPGVARLLAAMAPKSAIPKGSELIAVMTGRHPSGHGTGGYVLRMASGYEVAWDGTRIRSLPRHWREECKWREPLDGE